MGIWLNCGRYECCITGKSELIRLIPDSWIDHKKERQDVTRLISIHLDLAKEYNIDESDGWHILNLDGTKQAAYILNKKMYFSLEKLGQDEVIVRIGKALDTFTRIGIHYGLMFSLCESCIGLHGVTLLCGNEIIILSAPSGTGKTTLAGLLEKYCDAIVINGDFALLTPDEKHVIYEPTPFCGSSRRNLKHRFPINRVVFLAQAKENQWQTLNGREALKHFLSNAFVPTWDRNMQHMLQENILQCIASLHVNEYSFAPTQEAAETFFRHVESFN